MNTPLSGKKIPMFKPLQDSIWIIVFNATFNSISVISVLEVEETGVPGENHRPVVSH